MRSARHAILAGALAAILAAPAMAQGRTPPSQDELERRKADKLAEAWVAGAGWIADYDKARAKARETGKSIFAYFTRTYST